MGKPARPDRHRPGYPRHRADGLHPPGREGRRSAGERRVRQDPRRQGPGESAHAEVTDVTYSASPRGWGLRGGGPEADAFGVARTATPSPNLGPLRGPSPQGKGEIDLSI